MSTNQMYMSDPVKKGVMEYWDQSSIIYDASPGLGDDEEHRQWKEELIKAMGNTPQQVLDVGTGTGSVALLLAELGHQVTGVDFSEEMLKKARQKTAAFQKSVKLMQGDVERLSFEDYSFDCVTARFVLWTLANPEKAIREWMRVLKPGGRVVIIDGLWEINGILQYICHLNLKLYWLLKHRYFFRYRYRKDLSLQLPHPKGVRMEEIRGYMTNAGLTDITATGLDKIKKIQQDSLPWYFRYANEHPTYLLTGKVGRQ